MNQNRPHITRLKELRARYREELRVGGGVLRAAADAALKAKELKNAAPLAVMKFAAETMSAIADGEDAYYERFHGHITLHACNMIAPTLEDVFRNLPRKYLNTQGAIHIVEVRIDGVPFRFQTDNDWLKNLHVREEDKDDAVRVLQRLFWLKHRGCVRLAPHPKLRYGVALLQGDLDKAEVSETALALVERYKAYKAAGKTRAALFRGHAGVGKTAAAAYVAAQLGTRVLIIQPDTLDTLRDILSLVRSTGPDVIVIDEMDRTDSAKAQMSIWEALRTECDVILATVNHAHKLDFAMLRPGRFDDVIEMLTIPDKIRDSILEGLQDKDLRESYLQREGELLAAYLAEWVLRCNVEHAGKELADTYYDELLARQIESLGQTTGGEKAEAEAETVNAVSKPTLENRPHNL